MASKECVLAIKHNGTAAALDNVGIELDAAVIKEPDEPVPVVQAIADLLGDRCLAGYARELLLKPGLERCHERLAVVLAHPAPVISAHSSDRLLDRIERSDPLKRFACDRRITALGDVEEPAAQMRPTEGQRDGPARRGSNLLVGGIAIALHDAAIALKQLEPVDRAAAGSVAKCDGRRVGPTPGPIVASDGPEVSLLGAAAAGIEHRRDRLINRDLGRRQDELAQATIDRHKLRGRIADP